MWCCYFDWKKKTFYWQKKKYVKFRLIFFLQCGVCGASLPRRGLHPEHVPHELRGGRTPSSCGGGGNAPCQAAPQEGRRQECEYWFDFFETAIFSFFFRNLIYFQFFEKTIKVSQKLYSNWMIFFMKTSCLLGFYVKW